MPFARLPPLSSLRAFSAYAETGSVTRAGAMLNVSHAAISQQLKALETHLGVQLLDRTGRSLALTPAGEQLADTLVAAFGRIAQTVEELTGAEADRPLHVSTSPSLASNWLMPRLASFRAEHPGIDIMIDPTPALRDPAPGGIDVAIRYGEGGWPGLESEPLIASPIWIVAAPELIGSADPPDAEALLGLPWIQELGTTEASQWFERRGITGRLTSGITHVPGNLMLDGARNGQGIVVTTRLAVEEDVRAGRLLLLFEERTDGGYHIVTAPGVARPQVAAFIRWLRREGRA